MTLNLDILCSAFPAEIKVMLGKASEEGMRLFTKVWAVQESTACDA